MEIHLNKGSLVLEEDFEIDVVCEKTKVELEPAVRVSN